MIRVQALTHRYGSFPVLRDVDFHVPKGEVCGFVGPNGAGKTTAIRLIGTLLPPQAGRILVDGIDVEESPLEVRRMIGYMPDSFGVYDRVTVAEYLEFFAAAHGLPSSLRAARVDSVMDLANLGPLRDRLVAEMSKGMKQRLALARTMLHDPELLLLDEPANGLDPRARMEMRDLVLELQRLGKTVFLSSHILTELADIVSSVVILERGRLRCAGRLDEISGRLGRDRTVVLRLLAPPPAGCDPFADLECVRSCRAITAPEAELHVTFEGGDEAIAAIVRRAVERGLSVIGVEPDKSDLERVFLDMTHGELQ